MGIFDGKVVLVTGGARGQGAEHARGFVVEGAYVFITDILDEDGRSVEESLAGSCSYLHHDVSSEADWVRVIETISTEKGRLDVLVNNAGIYAGFSIAETSADFFQKVMQVNQFGTFLGMKTAIDLLRRTGDASIINISSAAGLSGFPRTVAYGSTKWAINGMTRVAALELAPDIRVNAVCPGLVDTKMLDANSAEYNQAGVDATPFERSAQPKEITDLVLFLASSKASYITGATIPIDGGSTA